MDSNILMKVGVPYLDPEICAYSLKGRRVLPGQLCAGGMPAMNACNGDSGGPLIASVFNGSGGKPICYQVGIVSIGFGSCVSSAPAIYTNVEDFMPWILDHIRD
jgi:secreted trypsin-like serine protease